MYQKLSSLRPPPEIKIELCPPPPNYPPVGRVYNIRGCDVSHRQQFCNPLTSRPQQSPMTPDDLLALPDDRGTRAGGGLLLALLESILSCLRAVLKEPWSEPPGGDSQEQPKKHCRQARHPPCPAAPEMSPSLAQQSPQAQNLALRFPQNSP